MYRPGLFSADHHDNWISPFTRTCVRSAKPRRRTPTRRFLGWTRVGDPIV